jgi:hypothetical protein
MRGVFGAKAGWACAVASLVVLTGCGVPGEGSPTVSNMVLLAGTTVPPPAKPPVEDVYCPPVNVAEGGAAIQMYTGGRTGDASALRSQIALGTLARECVGNPDGSTVVKVGVEGRALLGVGGSSGRHDVPVQIVVKRGSTVIANRVRRVAVTIPAGQTQAHFSVVEEGIVVPAGDASRFEIEVGLGGRAARRG